MTVEWRLVNDVGLASAVAATVWRPGRPVNVRVNATAAPVKPNARECDCTWVADKMNNPQSGQPAQQRSHRVHCCTDDLRSTQTMTFNRPLQHCRAVCVSPTSVWLDTRMIVLKNAGNARAETHRGCVSLARQQAATLFHPLRWLFSKPRTAEDSDVAVTRRFYQPMPSQTSRISAGFSVLVLEISLVNERLRGQFFDVDC